MITTVIGHEYSEGEYPNRQSVDAHYCIIESKLKVLVLETFKRNTGKDFDPKANNGEAGHFFNLLINYWTGNPKFLQNPLLVNEPESRSFAKGMLIMSKPGAGKTSGTMALIDTLHSKPLPFVCFLESVIDRNTNTGFRREPAEKREKSFIINRKIRHSLSAIDNYRKDPFMEGYHAEEIVRKYEEFLRGGGSEDFKKITNKGPITFIDDILSERVANNYGDRVETMKRVLEDMEYRRNPLILTCNFHTKDGVKSEPWRRTIEAIGERYGGRAYDRLFSSLNFVSLQGGSLRR